MGVHTFNPISGGRGSVEFRANLVYTEFQDSQSYRASGNNKFRHGSGRNEELAILAKDTVWVPGLTWQLVTTLSLQFQGGFNTFFGSPWAPSMHMALMYTYIQVFSHVKSLK